MSDQATITLNAGADPMVDDLGCTLVVHDPKLHGHPAELQVVLRVEVKDESPVHKEDVIYAVPFNVVASRDFVLPRENIRAYTYTGQQIDIELHVRMVVDDGVLFDTKISAEQTLELGFKAPVSNHAERIVEPPDRFLFLANLQAIPSQNRVIVLGLAIVAGIIMAVNALIGAHDQFVPEAATWFYSHYDTDGDSSSPLFGALAGSGVLGAAVWAMMRNQLRKYMSFRLKRMPTRIAPESVIDIGALIGGRPRVALEHVELRVVAANMEKGQYVRGSGSNRRTVSFSEPTRAVVLYKQQVASIAPGRPIEQYFSGAVDFAPMFSALYPPLRVGKNHGLDIYWEIQLLHPQFVDQELVGPITAFRYGDFLRS